MAEEQVEKIVPEVHCAHTEMVSLVKLVPNPRNPNRHPERQIQLLAKIITVQGWRAPVTISNRSGFIVRGHGRYEAAKLLSLDEVPVDYQDYESDAAEWADLIADNRIAELSEMDTVALKDLMTEMDSGAIDMDLTGFDKDALEDLMTWAPGDGDLPPDLPEPPVSGEDDSMGKLMLVYETDEEREEWLRLLGLEGTGNQVVFCLDDVRHDSEGE